LPESGEHSDATPEILNYVIQALREHEQEIDEIINRLGNVKDRQSSINQKLNSKAQRIEEKLAEIGISLQKIEVFASSNPIPPVVTEPNDPSKATTNVQNHCSIMVKCTQFKDFADLAVHADWVAFSSKEAQKHFQVQALKGKQLIIYTGEPPTSMDLMKTWLTRELEVADAGRVLDGNIKIT
jgi:hypothetical protein